MSITIGTRLRDFTVVSSLGAGGMGVVFLARDSRLERDVALKVLPEACAGDETRRARFAREAKALAALSHSGIASIHEFFEHESSMVLVMELVDGETLEAALQRGPLSISKARDVAIQMAEAIEHAHSRGIMHRDLKPSNVKITASGKVRLLDFGLARAFETEHLEDAAETRTAERSLTESQMVVGTAPYMSPEQVRGEPIDRRSDIFSFGAVMFETLTGTRAFSGRTTPDILVSVLHRDPVWDKLPSDTPAAMRRLLRRCLHKDPNRRLHDIADARIELEDDADRLSLVDGPRPLRPSRIISGLAALVVVLTLGLVSWKLPRPQVPAVISRISLSLSADNSLTLDGGIGISPDGRTLAFVANSPSGARMLFLRRIDEWQPRPAPGTEGARNPFFSPDGEWVAFARDDKTLEKIPVRGGPPQLIANVLGNRGGSWGSDGQIIFGSWPNAGLWRVSASGGTAELIRQPIEGNSGAAFYTWPEGLPGRDAFLMTVIRDGRPSVAIVEGTGEPQTLIEFGSHARYLSTGHLLYVADEHLYAIPFDIRRLALIGGPSIVVENIRQDPATENFAVSTNGTLAYIPASGLDRLVWKDRQGASVPLPIKPRRYGSAANLSPNGERFCVTARQGAIRSLWIGRVDREPLTRLTDGNDDSACLWTRDASRIAFTRGQSGRYNLFWVGSDGRASPERLTDSPHAQKPTSWSPTRNELLFNDIDPETRLDIWLWSASTRLSRAWLRTPYREMEAAFSPDGQAVAYQSDESGRYEIWVQPYSQSGPKVQISVDGGSGPAWSADGHSLYFQTLTQILMVPVLDARALRFGPPSTVVGFAKGLEQGKWYDVTGDGQRFVFVERDAGVPSQMNLVFNWFDELQKVVPPAQR